MGCNQGKTSTIDKGINKELTEKAREVDDDDEERAFFEAQDGKNIGLMSQSNVEVLAVQRARPSDVTKVLHHRWSHHHFSTPSKIRKSSQKVKRRRAQSISRYLNKTNEKKVRESPLRRKASTLIQKTVPDFLEVAHKFGIIHFNDVYEVSERKREPVGGAAKFASMVKTQINNLIKETGERPIIVFSGDCLNPSILSCATKGRHMVEVFNQIGVDVAVFGNHDFDFGVERATECMDRMNSVWLLSNVVDNMTQQNLGGGISTYTMIRKSGLKIGFIGLVEEEWLETLSTVNRFDLNYTDYVLKAKQLSVELKKQGVKFIIALTHMRWPNDVRLAQEVPEIDMILGGHDHEYAVQSVEECLIVKSGNNFRTFSSINIIIAKSGAIDVRLTLQEVTGSVLNDPAMELIVCQFTKLLEKSLDTCIGTIETELNGKYDIIRTRETALGNFVADIVAAATKADVVLINSGSFRSDGVHPKGEFRLNDLMTILPIADTVVTVLVTGNQLLQAFENGVSKYPTMDGRFPQISGASFGFDPKREPGFRIIQETVRIQGQPLLRNTCYHLATKAYVARGKDGYTCLSDCPILNDPDASPLLSTVIRNHFSNVRRLKEFEKNMNCKVKIAVDGNSVSCSDDMIDVSAAFITKLDDDTTISKITEKAVERSPKTSRVEGQLKLKGAHVPHFIAVESNLESLPSEDIKEDKLMNKRRAVLSADLKNAKLLRERLKNPTDVAWQVTPLLEARTFHCSELDVSSEDASSQLRT